MACLAPACLAPACFGRMCSVGMTLFMEDGVGWYFICVCVRIIAFEMEAVRPSATQKASDTGGASPGAGCGSSSDLSVTPVADPRTGTRPFPAARPRETPTDTATGCAKGGCDDHEVLRVQQELEQDGDAAGNPLLLFERGVETGELLVTIPGAPKEERTPLPVSRTGRPLPRPAPASRVVRYNPLWRTGFLNACELAVQGPNGRWTTAARLYQTAVVMHTAGGVVANMCLVPTPVWVYVPRADPDPHPDPSLGPGPGQEPGPAPGIRSEYSQYLAPLTLLRHHFEEIEMESGLASLAGKMPPMGPAPVVRIQHRKVKGNMMVTVLHPVSPLLRRIISQGDALQEDWDSDVDNDEDDDDGGNEGDGFEGVASSHKTHTQKSRASLSASTPKSKLRRGVLSVIGQCARGVVSSCGCVCFGVALVLLGIKSLVSWRTCYVEDPATRQFTAASTALLAVTVWSITAGFTANPAYVLVGPVLYLPAIVLQIRTGAPLPFQGTAAGEVFGQRNVDGLLWLYASLVALGVFLSTILLRVTAHALTPGMTALFFLGHVLATTSMCVLQAWQFDQT